MRITWIVMSIVIINMVSCYEVEKIKPYESKQVKLVQSKIEEKEEEVVNNISNEKKVSKEEVLGYYKIYHFVNNISAGSKTDLVLLFELGQGYTTKIVIYNTLSNIRQNEQKDFTDYVWKYTANQTEIVISSKDELYKGKGDYYIVIYDTKFYFKDNFRIFNEADVMELLPFCFSIPHLYSQNKLVFHMTTKQHESLAFHMTTKSKNSPSIEIRKGKVAGEVIKSYTVPEAQDYIELNPKETSYYLIISSNGTNDIEFGTYFCLDFLKKQIGLIDNEYKIKRFTNDMHYYYKLNRSYFNFEDESSIILNMDYTLTNSFDGFYCKYVIDTDDEKALLSLFPKTEEENECAVVQDEMINTSYHMFFRKNKPEHNALLIYLKVKGAHYDGSSFRLSMIEPIKDIIGKQYDELSEVNVPVYYRVNLNTIGSSIILYSDRNNVQSIIYGSLATGKKATKPTYNVQIFAVNKKEKDAPELPFLYIRIYGGVGMVKFESMTTDASIMYFTGETRPNIKHLIQRTICNNFIYFIGFWQYKSDNLFSIDTIYGSAKAYHLGKFLAEKRLRDMLPNGDNAKNVGDTKKVLSNVDMLKITCQYPMEIIINFNTIDKGSTPLPMGDSVKMLMKNNDKVQYDFGQFSKIALEAKIENIYAKVEVIVNNGKAIILNQYNAIYRVILSNDKNINGDTYPVVFTAKGNSENILSITTTKPDLFTIITQSSSVKSQNILIKINEDSTYNSLDLSLSIKGNDKKICISQGYDDIDYIPIPKYNCMLLKSTNPYMINIVNPFDKSIDKAKKPNAVYYVAIHFDNFPDEDIDIKIDYKTKPAAQELPNESMLYFNSPTPLLYRIPKVIDDKKDSMMYTLTPCHGKEVNLQLLLNNEEFATVKTKERLKKLYRNQHSEIDVILSNEPALFTFRYTTSSQYHAFAPTDNYTIDTHFDNNMITLKFNPYVKEKVKYDIYVLGNATEVLDECFLQAIESSITFESDGSEEIIKRQLEMKQSGDYQINIIATQLEGLKTITSYTQVAMTIVIVPKSLLWLWILIGSIGGIIIIGLVIFILCRKASQEKLENKASLIDPFDTVIT